MNSVWYIIFVILGSIAVIALTTGKKIFVKENKYEIRDLVVRYKQEVFNKIL